MSLFLIYFPNKVCTKCNRRITQDVSSYTVYVVTKHVSNNLQNEAKDTKVLEVGFLDFIRTVILMIKACF